MATKRKYTFPDNVDTSLLDRAMAKQAKELADYFLGQVAALESDSRERRAAAREAVASAWAAVHGWDAVRARRMQILAIFEAVPVAITFNRAFRGRAKQLAGIALDDLEKTALADSDASARVAKYVSLVGVKGFQDKTEHPDFEGEWALSETLADLGLTAEAADLRTGIAIMERRGRPRTSESGAPRTPPKWEFFSEFMLKIGLDKISPDALAADWREWRSEKGRGD